MDQVRNPTADSSDAVEPASTASTPSPPSVEPGSSADADKESGSAFGLIYTGSEAPTCEVEMIDRIPPADSPHDGGHAIIDHPKQADTMEVPRDQLQVDTDVAA